MSQRLSIITLFLLAPMLALGQEIVVTKVTADLTKPNLTPKIFAQAREENVALMAQPMTLPKPSTTTTPSIKVRAVHNGEWMAFHLEWFDGDRSEAGRLGEYSDAVALEFPKNNEGDPPPAFMGAPEQPVHIIHWRAQYQRDKERGKPTIKDLYANNAVDHYPFDYQGTRAKPETSRHAHSSEKSFVSKIFVALGALSGCTRERAPEQHANGPKTTAEDRERYQAGMAAGNPQSFEKANGVDDIVAEGMGTTQVLPDPKVKAQGLWRAGRWSVVIVRPLNYEGRSILSATKPGNVAFAVWQGGKGEVGSRKSLTLSWIPIKFL